jgi:hypothetical protein
LMMDVFIWFETKLYNPGPTQPPNQGLVKIDT